MAISAISQTKHKRNTTMIRAFLLLSAEAGGAAVPLGHIVQSSGTEIDAEESCTSLVRINGYQ
jgi:hypothetical protein